MDEALRIDSEGQVELAAGQEEPQLNMRNLRRFAELSKRAKKLKAEDDEIKAEMKELEAQILLDYERCGIQNMNVDGMTVYHHEDIWASPVNDDKEGAIRVLKAHPATRHFIAENYNSNTLSAWVRQCLREKEEALLSGDIEAAKHLGLPAEIEKVLKVSPRQSIRAKKS